MAETARTIGEMLPKEESERSSVALRLAITGYVSRLVCELILTELSETDKSEEDSDPTDHKNDEK